MGSLPVQSVVSDNNVEVISINNNNDVSGLSSFWPPEIQQWSGLIIPVAGRYKIDPNLIAAVMLYESGGNPRAVSRAGAQGLLQTMPLHACATYDPRGNIECGTFILADYFHRMGDDWRGALAAYNCGVTGAKRNDCGERGGWAYSKVVMDLWEQSKIK